ncbi:MAG TPA: hypothetical protein VNR36_05055 [Pseudolysinimonas sp.]|nr:hypothetical protein [Pseudolysinimonas sp.]
MTRTVTITCSAGSTRLEVPRDGIGLFEACALTCRGWIDRLTTRGVPDGAHTYSLHRLERRHRRVESRIVSRVEPLVTKLSVRAARLEVTAGMASGERASVPDRSALDQLEGRERLEWAKKVRAGHAANRANTARAERIHAAKEEVAEIRSEIAGLAAESHAVRLQWREAFMLRNARYTRARFGRRMTMSGAPALSDYRFAHGPDWTRSALEDEPGAPVHAGLEGQA